MACVALLATCLWSCAGFRRFLYEGIDRDQWQRPQLVIAELGIQPGETIADIGAGGGYFTRHLARATGETGIVYAVDIDPDMIAYVAEMARDEELPQVRTVLAAPDDPKLPDAAVDLAFFCDSYHRIERRPSYFARLRQALAANGRVAIIEFRQGKLFTELGQAADANQVAREMRAAGYRLERAPGRLDRQFFLIFSARD